MRKLTVYLEAVVAGGRRVRTWKERIIRPDLPAHVYVSISHELLGQAYEAIVSHAEGRPIAINAPTWWVA